MKRKPYLSIAEQSLPFVHKVASLRATKENIADWVSSVLESVQAGATRGMPNTITSEHAFLRPFVRSREKEAQ